VVLDTVTSTKCPVVGAVTKPSIVLEVVLGEEPIVNVPAPVAFAKDNVPVALEGVPNVGVAVKAGVAPARTCPATPVTEAIPVVAEHDNGAEQEAINVPLVLGNNNVGVPAVANGDIVTVPEVCPVIVIVGSIVAEAPKPSDPAAELPIPVVILPGVEILPLLSIVAVVAGVCRVVVPPPVTKAVEVNEPLETTVTVPLPALALPQAKAWVLLFHWSISVVPAHPFVPLVGRALNNGSEAAVPYNIESALGTLNPLISVLVVNTGI
jgi:hypothetical protein